ncbi:MULTISPECIES: sugar glycosyltransferase [unclassified Pantoea]|jgi:Kdo-III transferase WaaZ|uniref:sugar glycosyltransferase n=1 Tax=unclassified Pantoea TaxID=2630326 RepID=UPI000D865FAA|nr:MULTISPECIES: sugar glycosyltransferase [unclassified Pantoea]MBD9662193.1 sugar glycosyltransferase [Pantoea sp. PNT03]PYG46480.1 Kdo-III transferase WaaZ [Pantoea sp. AG1095]QCP61349.1 sugar glycosyltransferase [Pantoea sp. SO10]WFL67389.1 sugar glycosyltransferase [Pantoea sp. X85]
MTSIFKQIYRYTHARALRHNENLWPHIKIRRAKTDNIQRLSYWGKQVKIEDLIALRATITGDVTILATGPSVKSLDIEKLASTTFVGVNGAYNLRDRITFAYYVIVDRGFIDKRFDLVTDIINDEKLVLFTTVHCFNDILQRADLRDVKCRLAIIEDLSFKVFRGIVRPEEYALNYQGKMGISLSETPFISGFSWDICQGVFDAGTVAYWALQISVWLGASRILLAGVDMNNFSAPRFYESDNDKLPSLLESNFSAVIKPAFIHASRELERAGIKAYNLSLESALDENIFEKATPEAIF